MDTTLNHLVTTDVKSDLMDTRQESLSTMVPEISSHTSHDESILDLSQRTSTSMKIENSTKTSVFIDHWPNPTLKTTYNDTVDANEWQLNPSAQNQMKLNLEQSITDQFQHKSTKEYFMSDSVHKNQSLLDVANSIKKINRKNSRRILIREYRPRSNQSPYSPSDFLWSTFFSVIGERPVADEFFDHYLASVESSLEIDMKLEYCYDVQRDLYWLTQIQLVSHSLILLHYVGLPEDDTANDFWAHLYEKRCHPIGWCKENSKLMIPPPIVTKRAILQQNNVVPTTTCTPSNGTIKSSMSDDIQNHTKNGSSQFVPSYLFDQTIGLNPSEQLHVGMLLEIQDLIHPWTLWFVRIIRNRGGRLHLRYVTKLDGNDDENNKEDVNDVHIFYLDRRVHAIGWRSINSSIYSYDIPSHLKSIIDKQSIIEFCLNESKTQFLPPHVFKEQEEINKHHFLEGMKLEVFEPISQQIYVGHIGHVHNEFYFDVLIDHIDDINDSNPEKPWSFVAHSTHPHILPPHWAAEHKLILMKGKDHRQSDDYWNNYTETHGINDLAPDKCFNLITLNATGSNRMEPGMKMEMIYTIKGNDLVFSVTLIHVADHLMWLRVDNPTLFEDEHLFYHVLPINSLDVFPVGWAKFNGFDLVLPLQYQTISNNYEIDLRQIFSSITHHPRIPKIYLSDIDLLTIYVNIHCFSGPHLCSSRLARIPSKFGPGPYRQVLIDMFHHLLPTASANAHRALRRLDHQNHPEKNPKMETEQIKAAKKSSKLIRPVTIPTDPQLIHRYLRHICSQLEACPNLISIQSIEQKCPDKCHRLQQTFAFSNHSKHKRTGLVQLRAAQNRQKKPKSLLSHCKTSLNSILNGPKNQIDESNFVETTSEINASDSINNEHDISSTCDRQTRGFRFHIEPRTHTITRTNRKQKMSRQTDKKASNVTIQEESIETKNILLSNVSQSSASIEHLKQESKPVRPAKKKRSLSRESVPLISSSTDSIPLNKIKKNRRFPPNITPTNLIENSSSSSSSSSTSELNSFPLGSIQKNDYEINSSLVSTTSQSNLSSIDSRNPMTWNVNDVCWYLNKCGCSFALETIKEQEIDGAALLLLDDLNTVQDLLDFKLGPAVKFFHVVEQLRSRVIETVHSPPSLRSSLRLSSSSSSSARTS